MHEIRTAERCTGCGTHPDELDPDAGGHPDGFTTEVRFCRVCDLRAAAEKELEEQREAGGTIVPAGARVRVVRRTSVERREADGG